MSDNSNIYDPRGQKQLALESVDRAITVAKQGIDALPDDTVREKLYDQFLATVVNRMR